MFLFEFLFEFRFTVRGSKFRCGATELALLENDELSNNEPELELER